MGSFVLLYACRLCCGPCHELIASVLQHLQQLTGASLPPPDTVQAPQPKQSADGNDAASAMETPQADARSDSTDASSSLRHCLTLCLKVWGS